MRYPLDIASPVQEDMLALDDADQSVLEEFLVQLQDNPYPAGCAEYDAGAWFLLLPNGCYVSWELVERSVPAGVFSTRWETVIRLLGVARAAPHRPTLVHRAL